MRHLGQASDGEVKWRHLRSNTRDLAIGKDELSFWNNWFEEFGPAEDAADVH